MTTIDFHLTKLAKCCRVCGQYSGDKCCKYSHNINSPDIINKIQVTFGIDVTDDHEETHPQKCCNCCYAKCIKAEKGSKTTQIPVTWHKHTDVDCQTCTRFLTQAKGGRKRKTTIPGRPSEKQQRLENVSSSRVKISQSIIPPNVIPAPLIDKMPETNRFVLNPPPDLLCPICKEVLHQPVQSQCEHNFCWKCAQAWLDHVGQFAKCPVCSSTIEGFLKPPRVLLNILCSLLVSCAFCKKAFSLDRLQNHQLECDRYAIETIMPTIPSMLNKLMTTPLSKVEEKLATSLIKRKLKSADTPYVALKTGGTVSRLLYLYVVFTVNLKIA